MQKIENINVKNDLRSIVASTVQSVVPFMYTFRTTN
jgi:hypothetical protein